ncbi:MAG: hypothetical protein HY744_25520 [Deltaproteobacteria bacterium]|nr:hypothetical protein [Deltaproteobacteria bacterium]
MAATSARRRLQKLELVAGNDRAEASRFGPASSGDSGLDGAMLAAAADYAVPRSVHPPGGPVPRATIETLRFSKIVSTELNLGWFAPLHEAIPELAAQAGVADLSGCW